MGFFDSVWGGIKNVAGTVVSGIKSAGSFIADKVKSVVSGTVGAVKSAGSFIVQKSSQALSGLKDFGKTVITTLPKVIETGVNATKGLISSVNPFNNIGFIALAGLGIWAFVEFSKTPAATNLSRAAAGAAPMMV